MGINNLRYYADKGVFRASVDINRSGRTFRYPAEIHGSQDMDPNQVVQLLHKRALQMSDSPAI